jgi:multiple sugar transport system ATP-binding protein
MGAEFMFYSNLSGQDFVARIDARSIVQPGDTIELALNMNKAHFFDKKTELRISPAGK